MKRSELEEVVINNETIADIYEESLNPGLDFVDSVDINEDGSFTIYYSYDGENAYAKFNSAKEFLENVEKYGRFEEEY